MSLIKSISGIRGTIGGGLWEGLNPVNISKFVVAYAQCIKELTNMKRPTIVIGRDARISGEMVQYSVMGALLGSGCDVINIGLATTPTTEMAVKGFKADGGIIITASHNPKEWNALKLLNNKGHFFSSIDGSRLMNIVDSDNIVFASIDDIGTVIKEESYLDRHIDEIIKVKGVDVETIREANFTVSFDSINSVGSIAIPRLLERLGVKKVFAINDNLTGNFSHNPEPLPKNLVDICNLVKETKSDVAFVVDPDVDRLSIVDEKGECIGEEYTLVSIADYILSINGGGNTVSNLSSTRALRDVTIKYGGVCTPSAVGEVNVVDKMIEYNAIIGGEGNGGVIYPTLHSGRDALVGIALFLTLMAKTSKKVSEIRAALPNYYMSKQRVDLPEGTNSKVILELLANDVADKGVEINTIDGVKIDFDNFWVHIRSSNTEPILRIYSEAKSQREADDLANKYKDKLISLI